MSVRFVVAMVVLPMLTSYWCSAGEDAAPLASWHTSLLKVQSTAGQRAVRQFIREMNEIETEFEKKSNETRAKLAKALEKDRSAATKRGNLEAAVRLREAVRSLEMVQTDATAKKRQAMNPLRHYTGTWSGKWGSTGNPIRIAIDPNGNMIDERGPIKPIKPPYLFMTAHAPTIFAPMHDKIVTLTWATGKSPQRHQPLHAAILSRVSE